VRSIANILLLYVIQSFIRFSPSLRFIVSIDEYDVTKIPDSL